jgi:hypothetical protein
MLNNKYATTWTYYNRNYVYECHSGFSAVTKKYNTCILFIPSKNNHGRRYTILADHEHCLYSITTT